MKCFPKSITLLVCMVVLVEAWRKDNYQVGEKIDLWANTVGPFANPSETYEFYTVPLCPPSVHEKRSQRIGEIISGDRAVLTDYNIPFRRSFRNRKLCDMNFTRDSAAAFGRAISANYYFELLYDDLPIFGFVGTSNSDDFEHYLYTHWDFTILYNKDQVIHVNLTTPASSKILVPSPSSPLVSFSITYSATWAETKIEYSERRELYRSQYFPFRSEFRIHWIAIVNSITLVLFLTGFLFISVLRMLRHDYCAKNRREDDFDSDHDLIGWKVIHGDVFRIPPYKSLLCGFLGIGAQFLSVVIGTLILSLFGLFYPTNQGNIYSSGIALYAITSIFGGYVSAKTYKEFGGKNWRWNIVLVGFGLFALPFACSFTFLNGVARHFKVTTALPFVTILEVFCVWIFVGIPLTIVGGIAGRRYAGQFQPPVRVKANPRPIPALPWYRSVFVQMALAGFLPFSAIWLELFFIFNSVWGRHYYSFYGIICVVFIILLLVTACVNLALTYYLLSAEDYRWWWRSFVNGGATGIYIYAFSIWWFIIETRFTGALQTTVYFTYLLIGCYFFFVLLGTVGFFSSFVFVCAIYKQIGGFD